MKQILRFLIVGIVLGGAFGAKVGAYLGQVLEKDGNHLLEFCFVFGASLGLFISIITQLSHSGIFKKQTQSSQSIITYSS